MLCEGRRCECRLAGGGGGTIFLGALPLHGAGKVTTVALSSCSCPGIVLEGRRPSPRKHPAPAMPWAALVSVPSGRPLDKRGLETVLVSRPICREQIHPPRVTLRPMCMQMASRLNCAADKNSSSQPYQAANGGGGGGRDFTSPLTGVESSASSFCLLFWRSYMFLLLLGHLSSDLAPLSVSPSSPHRSSSGAS